MTSCLLSDFLLSLLVFCCGFDMVSHEILFILNSNSVGNSRATGLSVEDCCLSPLLNKSSFIYLFIYFIYLFILILHSSVWKLFLIGNYPLQDCRGKCHLSKSKIYCPGQSDLSYFLPWANSPRTLRANRAYSATTGFCFQFSTVITGVTEVMPLYDSPDLSAYILSLV